MLKFYKVDFIVKRWPLAEIEEDVDEEVNHILQEFATSLEGQIFSTLEEAQEQVPQKWMDFSASRLEAGDSSRESMTVRSFAARKLKGTVRWMAGDESLRCQLGFLQRVGVE